jgi:flagellar biosynthesis protein FliR
MTDPRSALGALSFIVAPAVLTNASSILVLSTSNRLARAVDRMRIVSAHLEQLTDERDSLTTLRLKELASSERRALMLLSALRWFYASIGSFALSAITALLGATLADGGFERLSAALEVVALGAGFVAVTGLVLGCVLLLRETRIAVRVVSEEAALLRDRFASRDRPQ